MRHSHNSQQSKKSPQSKSSQLSYAEKDDSKKSSAKKMPACLIETCLADFFQRQSLEHIVVAFSGGVDSLVLLQALARLKQAKKLKQTIQVCHVNHGLSDNALIWQQSALATCEALNLDCKIVRVDIAQSTSRSLEELAREARYNALINISDKPSLIVTGHHSDDQSETFLLALKRGAGIKGLSAMSKNTALDLHLLVRPLLNISREQIVDYANQHHLTWHEDESNLDQRFDRNFLRQSLLPSLKQRWPSISATINRSAAHCQEAQLLLDEIASDDLKQCFIEPLVLSVDDLLALSQRRFNNCIRYFLSEQQKLMPSTQQLSQLYQQVTASEDKQPAIKINDYWLRRFQQKLYLTNDLQDVSTWQQKIDLSELVAEDNSEMVSENLKPRYLVVQLPDNIGFLRIDALTADHFEFSLFDCRQVNQAPQTNIEELNKSAITIKPLKQHTLQLNEQHLALSLSFAHNNPKCLPDYRDKSRPLKKVLQELNIPVWQRKRIPFVFVGDQLVAALGFFVCKSFT